MNNLNENNLKDSSTFSLLVEIITIVDDFRAPHYHTFLILFLGVRPGDRIS